MIPKMLVWVAVAMVIPRVTLGQKTDYYMDNIQDCGQIGTETIADGVIVKIYAQKAGTVNTQGSCTMNFMAATTDATLRVEFPSFNVQSCEVFLQLSGGGSFQEYKCGDTPSSYYSIGRIVGITLSRRDQSTAYSFTLNVIVVPTTTTTSTTTTPAPTTTTTTTTPAPTTTTTTTTPAPKTTSTTTTPAPTTTTDAPATQTTQVSTAQQKNKEGTCNFDHGMCGWINMVGDDFDWLLHSGTTPTDDTGPARDHTLGNITGQYIYIETSAPRKLGDKAWLISPRFSPSVRCLTFWYSMYGNTTDSLNVYVSQHQDLPEFKVWQMTGDKGPNWKQAHVAMGSRLDFYINFEATVADGYLGDIAIDDIVVTDHPCAAVSIVG